MSSALERKHALKVGNFQCQNCFNWILDDASGNDVCECDGETLECGMCGDEVDSVDENGECESCAEVCDHCACVCMGDVKCISCSGKCTCKNGVSAPTNREDER